MLHDNDETHRDNDGMSIEATIYHGQQRAARHSKKLYKQCKH